MSVLPEVLAANEAYVAELRRQGPIWRSRRPASSRSSPAWTPASTRPSTPD